MKNDPKLLEAQILLKAAECLKVMAHPIRLRIVDILMQGSFPVCEIAQMCELPQHQTSEHLRLLKGHSLLDSKRDGRKVYYEIASPQLPGLLNCIKKNCNI